MLLINVMLCMKRVVLGSDGVLLRAMVEFQCVFSVWGGAVLYLTYNTGSPHTCILYHTAVTLLSELQCYFSGVFSCPSVHIYVCIVYVLVGVVLWPFSLDVLCLWSLWCPCVV